MTPVPPLDEALASLQRGRECLQRAEFAAAEQLLRNAIAQNSELSRAYELLGKLLYRDCRAEEAAAVYRSWQRAVPTDPVAAHLLAATGGATVPERASDGFISSVYGRAAPDFDAALANLGYRAPRLLFECAADALDRGAVALDVLDLGCGTGLCGEWFRPLAGRLVGVDLSSEMLEQARRRGCYDELLCEELTAYLGRCADSFDLITAADVFCYFGDLTAVFAAVARILRPKGRFIFSVEELSLAGNQPGAADTARLALLEHGRYAHGVEHLDHTLTTAGLAPGRVRREMLRFERGAPVEGLIAAAHRR